MNRVQRRRIDPEPSKYQRLHELLGALGNGHIDVQSFWKRMAEHDLTAEDIDAYCAGECWDWVR